MTEKTPERWFDDRVEAYVDGALPDNERRMFEARLALDDALGTAVTRARRLSAALGNLPVLECPDQLSRSVLQMTRSQARLPMLGWALAGAMVLAVGVGFSRFLVVPGGAPEDALSQVPDAVELARARADLALALAYVDRAGQVAAREIGQQVVTRGVRDPVAAGVSRGRQLVSPDGDTI